MIDEKGLADITEEEIARAIRDAQHMPPPCDHPQCDCGWDCEREALSVAAYTEAARAVLSLVLPAIERARVEERERAVLACEDQMPATQDMESTEICEALERAAAAIRKG